MDMDERMSNEAKEPEDGDEERGDGEWPVKEDDEEGDENKETDDDEDNPGLEQEEGESPVI